MKPACDRSKHQSARREPTDSMISSLLQVLLPCEGSINDLVRRHWNGLKVLSVLLLDSVAGFWFLLVVSQLNGLGENVLCRELDGICRQ